MKKAVSANADIGEAIIAVSANRTIRRLFGNVLAASVIRLGRTRMSDGTEVLQVINLLARREFYDRETQEF